MAHLVLFVKYEGKRMVWCVLFVALSFSQVYGPSRRYSRARNLTLREWPSEIENRLLQKCASWPTPIISPRLTPTRRDILKDLHHDHIVQYHDRYVDRDAGMLYIFLEYCGGGDLSTIINQAMKQNRPTPEDTIPPSIEPLPSPQWSQWMGLRLMAAPSMWKEPPDEFKFCIAILNRTMVRPHTLQTTASLIILLQYFSTRTIRSK